MQSILHALKWFMISKKPFESEHVRFLKAVEDNDIESVQSLLDEGKIDVNLTDQNGIGPLYQAVSEGHLEMVRLLLAREETDVNVADVCGTVPLHIAAQRGYREIFRMLLDQKDIDINVANNDGRTPLHMAVYLDDQQIVGMLLGQKKLNVNAKNNAGNTPLHLAIKFKRHVIAKKLLATTGIDLDVVNDYGLSPLGIAVIKKSLEAVQLLLTHGAIIDESMHRSLLNFCLETRKRSLFQQALISGLNIAVYPEFKSCLSEPFKKRLAHQKKMIEDALGVSISEDEMPKILRLRPHHFPSRKDFQEQVGYGPFFDLGRHFLVYQKLSRGENLVPLKGTESIEAIEKNVFCELGEKSGLLPEMILIIIQICQHEQMKRLAEYCDISESHAKGLYSTLSEPNHTSQPSKTLSNALVFPKENLDTVTPIMTL